MALGVRLTVNIATATISSSSSTSSANHIRATLLRMAQNAVPSFYSSISTDSLKAQEKKKKKKRNLPILLFDVMDTLVRDPFYQDVPQFFRMSFDELIQCKHPTAWVEFEKGLINEAEFARKFFKDGRPFDLEGLKNCMKRGYSYIDGIEALLHILKQNNYEMHAFTNYPIWYTMIEEKLKISTYMSWTFCSCATGKRKPKADSYLEVLTHLDVEPASCIFIDDRMVNVEAAVNAGIVGLHFKDASSLQEQFSQLGIDVSSKNTENAKHQDLTKQGH